MWSLFTHLCSVFVLFCHVEPIYASVFCVCDVLMTDGHEAGEVRQVQINV
jgi:hypothetical protein